MEHLAGNFSFNRHSNTHQKEINIQIHWVSLPAEPNAIDPIDRFSVTMRLFSIEDGSPHGKRLFSVVQQNDNWVCGEYQNQIFHSYDTDLSREIAERVVVDCQQTLEHLPDENANFWEDL